jgi:ribosomal-protein-alanine N-acetyltransferase
MPVKKKLNVRRATREDLTAIIRIERASFGRDAWGGDWFLDYLSERKNCLFLVALKGETIVGYAIVVHNETHSELDSIVVSPSERGGGIAAALLPRLTVLLRRRGVSTMSLLVRLDNVPAIELYRKLGFRRERRINGYYDDGAPAWRMKVSV